MPDFDTAVEVINLYKEKYLQLPPFDVPEHEFKRCSDERWAADDLLEYLEEHWFTDIPVELIADYIDEVRHRSVKYPDHPMAEVYNTAKETAEEIMLYFV